MSDKIQLNLKSLLVPTKEVESEFPGFSGFKVSLAFLSREKMVEIRKKATKNVWKSRQLSEDLNEELFLQLYVNAAIKGWKGLKLAYLEQLAPVDLSGQDLDVELPYTEENALFLMKSSTDFDAWVSDQVNTLGKFQKPNESR